MMRLTARAATLALTFLAAACATRQGEGAADAYSSAPIDPNRLSIITKTLASDEFEGRAPGTAGDAKTVAYLSEQFRQLGLEPAGDNGTFLQRVPLIRTQLQKP